MKEIEVRSVIDRTKFMRMTKEQIFDMLKFVVHGFSTLEAAHLNLWKLQQEINKLNITIGLWCILMVLWLWLKDFIPDVLR